MDPPHFLLHALTESTTSGTFVDTKFYVFSRRDASGRVGSPRSLYCNSRVLDTVPYFSTLFSDGFSEGQTRDINGRLPSDSLPYTDSYDYLSDSDLEDEEFELLHSDSGSQVTEAEASKGLRQLSQDADGAGDHTPHREFVRPGKVALIRDIAAVTFEAMLYFLYTGEVTFAPHNSDPGHRLPGDEKNVDWNAARVPSPSAKSIYRLADKYDLPTLKERAKAHICANLAHCNIVDEVFSSFSFFCPEILPAQVSQLVRKIKEESTSNTMGQLQEKISSLSKSELKRATDALAMIWDGMTGLQEPPVPKQMFTSPGNFTPLPNWHRVKLALHKSILTGTFVDVQLYAYNAFSNNLPQDPTPLFTSSIVIEEWASSITTHTAGIDSKAAFLADGLTDDYECSGEELPKPLRKGKSALYQTEAAAATGGSQVVILVSGAWKTWVSLLSYAYTNKINFTPLQTSSRGSGPVGVEVRLRPSCSPRSMYSLTAALGAEDIKESALKDIQLKLTTSNVIPEIFTSFAANHKAVMDVEIKFLLQNFAEKPRSIKDYLQKIASGEMPFFPTTLSLIYTKLAEKVVVRPMASGSGVEIAIEIGDHSSITSSSQHVPDPAVLNTTVQRTWLKCLQCHERTMLQDLFDGERCPRCPSRSVRQGRPCMRCSLCNRVRIRTQEGYCARRECGAQFV